MPLWQGSTFYITAYIYNQMEIEQVKKDLSTFLTCVAKPIAAHPAFFVMLYLVLFMPDILFLIVEREEFPDIQLTSGILLCYLLTLPLLIKNRVFCRMYEYTLMLLALVMLMMNLYMLWLYGEAVNYLHTDTVAALRASNPDEIREYLSTYITGGVILSGIVIVGLILLLFHFLNRFSFVPRSIFGLFLYIYISFSFVMTYVNWERINTLQIFWIFKEAVLPDLNAYRQNPELLLEEDAPENIVLIVGESFSRSNSSLYGYEKNTNPMLHELEKNGELSVFKDVDSYTTTTIPSFKAMMTGYKNEYADSVEWYECLTLIEVMQKAGYTVHWLSNQSKHGICDNEIGLFADMCDEQAFVGDKIAGMKRTTYDGELLPLIDKSVGKARGKNFYVVHLMGSHSKFSARYPDSYSFFTAEDYEGSHPHLSPDKRQLLSTYDNSIRYNDRVVYDMINRFSGKDAVVVYLSDHGIDVFASAEDYIGHAIKNDSVSMHAARKIPFVIYTSGLCKEKHPQLQRRIENSLDNHIVTDKLMYTIMDIAGVLTVNGVSYRKESILE